MTSKVLVFPRKVFIEKYRSSEELRGLPFIGFITPDYAYEDDLPCEEEHLLVPVGDDDTSFSAADAERVVSFAQKHADGDLVVFCDAGMSRSVGCATALAAIFDKEMVVFVGVDTFANNHIKASILRGYWESTFQ